MRKCGLGACPRLSAGQRTEQEGQGLVEWGLLLSVVTAIIFAALAFLKDQSVAGYSRVGLSLPLS